MINVLRWFVRVAGLGALALGITFLFALNVALLSLHTTLGGIVALLLAILAVWALIVRARVPAAIAALFWAVATVYVGMMRNRGTAGEIIHVLLGIGAIGLAEMLAAAITRKRASLA